MAKQGGFSGLIWAMYNGWLLGAIRALKDLLKTILADYRVALEAHMI
jgi:hypothetical protein